MGGGLHLHLGLGLHWRVGHGPLLGNECGLLHGHSSVMWLFDLGKQGLLVYVAVNVGPSRCLILFLIFDLLNSWRSLCDDLSRWVGLLLFACVLCGFPLGCKLGLV